MPEYNYFHSRWHPYCQGRDVQFLIIIPSRDRRGRRSVDMFGTKARNVFTPLVDALLKDDQP